VHYAGLSRYMHYSTDREQGNPANYIIPQAAYTGFALQDKECPTQSSLFSSRPGDPVDYFTGG